MNTLINNVFSFLTQKYSLASKQQVEQVADELLAGICLPLGGDLGMTCQYELERRDSGILYADIANYARLTEADEEGTHRRLVESMEDMKRQIALNGGQVAHLAGDAVLAEFDDAESALCCAINVQLAARSRNAEIDIERQVLFRIGINFGSVISDQGDIFGNAVNLAARLEALACSGGICVSESVRLALDNSTTVTFVDLGKRYVKNISEPVQAFWIEVDARELVHLELNDAVEIPSVIS